MRPIVGWAAVGVGFLVFAVYLGIAWVVRGNFERTPNGPSDVPIWMYWTVHGVEVISYVGGAAFAYWYIWRPWRRDGQLSLGGMVTISFFTIYWQDPLMNYVTPFITYNSIIWTNHGSWTEQVPGWQSPHGNLLPDPNLMGGFAYVLFIGITAFSGARVMRKLKSRWPSLSKLQLIGLCYLYCVVLDIVVEVPLMGLGFYTYPNSISWLTINHGHYYQFPVYEALLLGVSYTAWACLLYFRNDRGETFAERGVSELKVPQKQKNGVRLLAMIGISNLILLLYYIPIQWFAMQGDAWPQDIQNRSYLTNGLCGPGTDYACSAPMVPMPIGDSAHLAPDGSLVPAAQ
jgi:hypothetical protein